MAEIADACASGDPQESHILGFHSGQKLLFIPFAHIQNFRGHPFRHYEGERLSDMVESIRQNGILMPLIVRPLPSMAGCYEMLSGHNRMNAGALAGLEGALSLVKDNLTDAEALMYVIETNLMQRSLTDLLPSEKAAVLALRYSKMFSQGKRNDIRRELRLLEDPTAAEEDSSCGTECHKLKNRDAVGSDYGLKGRAVAEYLRIHQLTGALKRRVDDGGMTLKAGVSLSYLSEESQQAVEIVQLSRMGKLTDAQAAALRKRGGVGTLTTQIVRALLTDRPPKSGGTVQVSREAYAPYFAPDAPAKEIERIIAEALKLYFEHQGGIST